ncbi:glycosyltransferase family 39 protein [Candidatus Gottesmanbacteria bacterium]|nr:glycosyltransferase family 39 protein [Candidatus Gottesmanbacteria bacterium]
MKTRILFFLIITLSLFLRTWKIDKFPATLYGDEQAFAWNAYNILHLGTDEYGNPYPLQFKSFDDYKAPIPVYLLVPFIKILGFNPFAIRLPIALASIITVVSVYFLSRIFLNRKISLIITFLMAVSPWHIHLSRGFFEATLALLWFILGIYFFLKSGDRLKLMLLSMMFFGLSLYSYFTPRILVPIFLVFLIWYKGVYNRFLHLGNSSTPGVYRRRNTTPVVFPCRGILKAYLLSSIFLIFITLPLLKLTFFDKGFSRFNKLSEGMNTIIVNTVGQERFASGLPQNWRILFHNKATVWLRMIKNNYLEHLSANFWYIYGDNSLRYFTGNMGMFYLLEFPFMILGLYYLWKDKKEAAILFLGWILLAPIPASLVGRSFAVRSMSMLPAPFIFVGYGIYKLMRLVFGPSTPGESLRAAPGVSLRNGHLEGVTKLLLPGVITFGFVLSIGTLLIRYYLEYPVYAATWWGWENKAALDYAKARESKYDKIFISDFYSGGTLAFAVYNKYDPLKYRYAVNHPVILSDGRKMIRFGKYYYGSLDLDDERLRNKVIPDKSLYIGRPEEPEGEDRIVAPDDGRLIFVVHDTLKKQ